MAKENNRKSKKTQCGTNFNGNDLRKGLDRKVCEMITRKEVAANRIEVNLVRAGRRLRKVLLQIDKMGGLYRGRWLSAAVYRYEIFWLPLLAESKLSKNEIMPPMDIYWAWLLHMSDPKHYQEDCKNIAGKVMPHQLCTMESLQEKQSAAETLWRNKYPEESWYLNRNSSFFKEDDDLKKPFNEDSDSVTQKLQYNFEDSACHMQRLIYQISGAHYNYKPFLVKAALKYRRFLTLQKKYPKAVLVPSSEVHWMWLAHAVGISCDQSKSDKCMLNYSKDMMHMFNEIFALPSITHGRPESVKYQTFVGKTNELWMKNYGQPYYCRGATYRGHHPEGYLKRFEDLIPSSATDTINFQLKVMEVFLSGNFKKGSYLLKLKKEKPTSLTSRKLLKLKVNHTRQHGFTHDFSDQNLTFIIPQTGCEHSVSLSAYSKNTINKIKKFFGQRKFCSISDFRELRSTKDYEKIIKKVFEDSVHGSKVEIEFEVHNRSLMSWYQQESCRQTVPSRVLSSHEMASFCGVIARNKMLQCMPIVAPRKCIHRMLENGTSLSSNLFNIEVSRQAKNNLTCVTLYAKSPEQEPLPVVLIHNLDHAATPTRSQLKLSRPSSLVASLVNTEAGEQAFIVKTYSGDLATVIGHWQRSKGAKEGELIVRIAVGSDAEAYCVVVPYEKLQQSPLIGTHHRVDQKIITISGKAHEFLGNVALGLAITILYTLFKPVTIQTTMEDKLNDVYSFGTKLDFPNKPSDGIVNFLAGLGALCLTAPDSDNFRKKSVKSSVDRKQLHCYVPILSTPVQDDSSDSSSDESDEEDKASLKSTETTKKVQTQGPEGRLSAGRIEKNRPGLAAINETFCPPVHGASYPPLAQIGDSTAPTAPPAMEFSLVEEMKDESTPIVADLNDDFGWNVSDSSFARSDKRAEKMSIHDLPTVEVADKVDFENIKHLIPKCRPDDEEYDLPSETPSDHPIKEHKHLESDNSHNVSKKSDAPECDSGEKLSKREIRQQSKQKNRQNVHGHFVDASNELDDIAEKVETTAPSEDKAYSTDLKNSKNIHEKQSKRHNVQDVTNTISDCEDYVKTYAGVNADDTDNGVTELENEEYCEPFHLTEEGKKHREKEEKENASKVEEDGKVDVEENDVGVNADDTNNIEDETENEQCGESIHLTGRVRKHPEKQKENASKIEEDVKADVKKTELENDGSVNAGDTNNDDAETEDENCEPIHLTKRERRHIEKQKKNASKIEEDLKAGVEEDCKPPNWNKLSKKQQKRLEKDHMNKKKGNRNTHDNEMSTENVNCEDDCDDSYAFERSKINLTKREKHHEKPNRERENMIASVNSDCEGDDVEQEPETTSDIAVHKDFDVEQDPQPTQDVEVHEGVENNEQTGPNEEDCEPSYLSKREEKLCEKQMKLCNIPEPPKTKEKNDEKDWRPSNWNTLSKKVQKRLEKEHKNQENMKYVEVHGDVDVEQEPETTSDIAVHQDFDIEQEPDPTNDVEVHESVKNNEQTGSNEEDCEPSYLPKREKKLCEKQMKLCNIPEPPKTKEEIDENDWRPSNWNTLSKKGQKRLEKEHKNQQNMKVEFDNANENDDAAGKMFLKTTDVDDDWNQQKTKSGKKGKRK